MSQSSVLIKLMFDQKYIDLIHKYKSITRSVKLTTEKAVKLMREKLVKLMSINQSKYGKEEYKKPCAERNQKDSHVGICKRLICAMSNISQINLFDLCTYSKTLNDKKTKQKA